MQIREKTKPEIESKSGGMSDFLKIDYLEECLKQNFSFDIKKFCSEKLIILYEQRRMFSEAARKLEYVGGISLTFREKKQCYVKAAELYIKAEIYEKAEHALRKAQENGNIVEKKEMKKVVIRLLKQQAEVYENENRKAKALKAYEHFYRFCDDEDKKEIKEKLLELYLGLGMISEYNILKGN